MIKDISSIKIGPVWNGGRGASYKEKIHATPDLGVGIKMANPVQADIMLVRMKNGITVVLSNLETGLEATCARCLETFVEPIRIAATEAHFYENTSHKDYDQTEVFYIQKQKMAIDLTDAIRQEIILHFPMIPVCSERCLGLCTSCRVNLNHTAHRQDCKHSGNGQQEPSMENSEIQHPFANLKDILK